MQKIHDNIYVHNTTGGFNVGCVVDKEGAISIDLPLLVDEALQWRGEIQQLTPKPLRMVLFTSVDRVNSEAMKALAPNLGAFGLPALIHDVGFSQLYAALEASQPRMLEPLSPVQLRERAVLPDLTYSEATTFTLGSENPIYLDITSANTFMPGSSVVTVRDTGIIFTGWLVAGNEPPALQKGNIDAWLAALAWARAIMAGERSMAVTLWPRPANTTLNEPVPQPISKIFAGAAGRWAFKKADQVLRMSGSRSP